MKFPRLIAGIAVAGLAISSCHDDAPEASVDQLSSFAKTYVGMRFGGSSYDASSLKSAPGNIANESFNRLFNTAASAGGRKGEDQDTTLYDDPWPWQPCAIVTTTENEDHSTTITYDYGDGCFEGYDTWKYWSFGKYTYTSRFSSEQNGAIYTDDYMYKYVADNYGGKYISADDTTTWMSDGYSNYEGTSMYDEEHQKYEGHFSYDYNSTYTWNNQAYPSAGHGVTSYDQNKSVIEERDDYYKQSEDEYYRSTVLTPLVMRWDCYSHWAENYVGVGVDVAFCWFPTYVSGRELIRYKQDGIEGSFIIDYGDGSCDSKITVIENNTSVALDLALRRVTSQMK
jgi:hypothetical protein